MIAFIIPIVAVMVRYIVIAIVQLGIWTAIEKWVFPKINDAIVAIMEKFGVSEETAKDIMSNDIIEFGESVGVFAVTLKSKLPLKVAEFLGFTTKGWSKRVLQTQIAKYLPFTAGWLKVIPKATSLIIPGTAPAVVQGAIKAIPGFKVAYDMIFKGLGVTFVGTMAISGVIDFGNWNSGAYQKKMQKVIAFLSFGLLTPDEEWRTSRTLSTEIFDKIFNTYKIEGAQFINDPYKAQSVLFTRDNLLDFLDVIGAELLKKDGSASTKEVMLAALPFIVFDVSKEVTATAQQLELQKTEPQVKVFTGVVTQGKLAEGVTFVARETDMIDDIDELQRAAENNLASFIMALPGKVIYEIKVVSSVTSKDGFTQRGTTQKIISGHFENGTPKYKTITNKFAQLKIYVVTEKGTKTNIATVTLGPVNSAVFNPSGSDLSLAEQEIKSNITTTDIADIKTIETVQPVEVIQTPRGEQNDGLMSVNKQFIATSYAEALNNLIPLRFMVGDDSNGYHIKLLYVGYSPNVLYNTKEITRQQAVDLINSYPDKYKSIGGSGKTLTGEALQIQYPGSTDMTPWEYLTLYPLGDFKGNFEDITKSNFGKSAYVWAYKSPTGEVLTNVPLELVKRLDPNSATAGTNPLASSNPNKCMATTISDWFGGATPGSASIEARAKIYETWGLGQAVYYTGTAEQNNKLLAEMKRRSGC